MRNVLIGFIFITAFLTGCTDNTTPYVYGYVHGSADVAKEFVGSDADTIKAVNKASLEWLRASFAGNILKSPKLVSLMRAEIKRMGNFTPSYIKKLADATKKEEQNGNYGMFRQLDKISEVSLTRDFFQWKNSYSTDS